MTQSARKFKISQATQQAGVGLLDIPTLAVFRSQTVEQLRDAFQDKWGVPLGVVAIPANEPDGLLYDVEGLRDARRSQYVDVSSELAGFADVVSAIADAGIDIVLVLNPALSFMNIDALQVQDILGSPSSPLCIGQSRTQDILAAILGTGVDIALSVLDKKSANLLGIAIDASNLWPIGAKGARVEASCFCVSCLTYFETVSPGLVKRFRTFPNPWSLLLHGTQTGVSFVSDFGPRSSPEEVVGLSRRQGFTDAFPDASNASLMDDAALVLRYSRARHDQTVAALQRIFTQACDGLASNPPRTIVVSEGVQYDWTSGLWIEDLDQSRTSPHPPFDEVWFNSSSQVSAFQTTHYRTYMARRGRYLLADFFQLCASAGDPGARSISGIARYPQERLRLLVQSRGDRVLGSLLGGHALAALPDDLSSLQNRDHGGRLGFVAPGIDAEFMEKYVAQLRIARGLADREDQQSAVSPDLLKLFESMRVRPAAEEDE